MEYIRFEEDKEYQFDPKKTFLRLACCDCDLVHDIGFRIDGDKISINLKANNDETKKLRKISKIDGLIVDGKEYLFKEVEQN